MTHTQMERLERLALDYGAACRVHGNGEAVHSAWSTLVQELAAVRADASRWRYFRVTLDVTDAIHAARTPDELDAAVDAAINDRN